MKGLTCFEAADIGADDTEASLLVKPMLHFGFLFTDSCARNGNNANLAAYLEAAGGLCLIAKFTLQDRRQP